MTDLLPATPQPLLPPRANPEPPNPRTPACRRKSSRPVQSRPVQSRPVQAQPVQTRPVQTRPVQTRPVQARPGRGGVRVAGLGALPAGPPTRVRGSLAHLVAEGRFAASSGGERSSRRSAAVGVPFRAAPTVPTPASMWSRYDAYEIAEYTPQCIAEHWIRDPDRWGQTLVFVPNRCDSELLYLLLRQAGVAVEMANRVRDVGQQAMDFRRGRIDVLIRTSVQPGGFDSAETRTVFCRPGGRRATVRMASQAMLPCRTVAVKQVVQSAGAACPLSRVVSPERRHQWTGQSWTHSQ